MLLIDIGNSRVKIGRMTGGELRETTALPTTDFTSAEDWSRFLTRFGVQPEGMVGICSVVPIQTEWVREANRQRNIDLFEVTPAAYPYPILYRTPETLGRDRLASAAGAYDHYRRALIVVDFGTALTINAVRGDGAFLGGAIFPGPTTALRALISGTAQLPDLVPHFTEASIGQTTNEAISSGIMWGTASLVDGMIARFEAEMGEDVLATSTGGMGREFLGRCQRLGDYNPNLSLSGIAVMMEHQRRSQ